MQTEFATITLDNKTLKTACDKMNDELIDLKCRSMRDNLLFFGINEEPRNGSTQNATSTSEPIQASADPDTDSASPDPYSTENCHKKLLTSAQMSSKW